MHHLNQQHRFQWLKKPILSGRQHLWLIGRGSLTMSLRQRYADFSVKLVTAEYAKPFLDEVTPLKIPLHKHVLIREVLLMGNNQAVVFAHSILPRESLRGRWLGMGRLGNRPLGESLFANPQVRRTVLSFKKLSHHHLLFQHATQHLNDKPAYLWARRSVFLLNCAQMMVTEVFLPELLR
ncbi:chorismate pyruvate-lyase [mine drainage metagenome]|uniref:Chorismate pyruvate-lyase n=1 Tax=mine drainage metagenome TaxID=410659 RepID=A0A1J5RLL1_9ZZZZ